jgi:hypothetical protein
MRPRSQAALGTYHLTDIIDNCPVYRSRPNRVVAFFGGDWSRVITGGLLLWRGEHVGRQLPLLTFFRVRPQFIRGLPRSRGLSTKQADMFTGLGLMASGRLLKVSKASMVRHLKRPADEIRKESATLKFNFFVFSLSFVPIKESVYPAHVIRTSPA